MAHESDVTEMLEQFRRVLTLKLMTVLIEHPNISIDDAAPMITKAIHETVDSCGLTGAMDAEATQLFNNMARAAYLAGREAMEEPRNPIPYKDSKILAQHELDGHCPKSPDKTHCEHWWDVGEICCYCGAPADPDVCKSCGEGTSDATRPHVCLKAQT